MSVCVCELMEAGLWITIPTSRPQSDIIAWVGEMLAADWLNWLYGCMYTALLFRNQSECPPGSCVEKIINFQQIISCTAL